MRRKCASNVSGCKRIVETSNWSARFCRRLWQNGCKAKREFSTGEVEAQQEPETGKISAVGPDPSPVLT